MKIGLNNNQLKIIAIIAMTIDHIGMALFPSIRILRIIGRIAFPIFAYMIAEGFVHTKNRVRYLLSLLFVGVVCQAVYFVVTKSLYANIILAFAVSVAVMLCIENYRKKSNILSATALIACAIAVVLALTVLPTYVKGFRFDYGAAGILLPVMIYLMPTKREKILCLAIMLIVISSYSARTQWYCLISVPLLALYNGERGKLKLKYLFYIFYPVHLGVIYIIKLLMEGRLLSWLTGAG